MMNRIITHPSTCLILIFFTANLSAQNTVGLITHDDMTTQDGYTLFYPAGSEVAYLIDNCGRVVHQWTDTIYKPGNAIYLMDNGDVVRCGKQDGTVNPVINAGGAGEMVDRRDWNGQLIWRYTYNSPTYRMHHDVEVLPNGNVLILAWELISMPDMVQAGKDTSNYQFSNIWPDMVIEVEPLGIDSGNIVWEWHAWDHLVQDFDSTKANYGVIADHPERLNVNYGPQNPDWMHGNAIHYNAALDQIILSPRSWNEIWVIDHSTTTAEAAGSTGGNSGKGGDILYRWGNPAAYDRGTAADQTLFGQHDARWLGEGLNPNDPDSGKILLFNNRIGGNMFSSVDMIVPPVDPTGNYQLNPGTAYGPDSASWRYTAPVPDSLFSGGLSGAHKLPNGNFLICSGRQGWIFEVDAAGTTAWEYKIPLQGGSPVAQGTVVHPGQSVFRATKYPADHPFLIGQSLTPTGYIELQPDTTFCGQLSVSVNEADLQRMQLYPNPTTGLVNYWSSHGGELFIRNSMGQMIATISVQHGLNALDLSEYPSGVYLLQHAHTGTTQSIVKE